MHLKWIVFHLVPAQSSHASEDALFPRHFGTRSRALSKFLPHLPQFLHSLNTYPNSNKMPSKLSKIQKHVTKKKGAKATSLHENSRDAHRLRQAGARDDKVARMTAVRNKVNKQWIDRVAFFRDRLPETLHPLEAEKIQGLVRDYLARSDEEIEQLRAGRRAGRPASTRQTLLEQQRKVEEKEFESGFWMPNLQDEETITRLDGWKGDWVGLGVMRFVRVSKDGTVGGSAFPPRGAS